MNKLERKIDELKSRLIEIHESERVYETSLSVMKDLEKDICDLLLIANELSEKENTSGDCPRCGEKISIKGNFIL